MCLLCSCLTIFLTGVIGVLVWYFFFKSNTSNVHITNRIVTEDEFRTSIRFDIEKRHYEPTDYGRWRYFNNNNNNNAPKWWYSTSGVCFTFFAIKVRLNKDTL